MAQAEFFWQLQQEETPTESKPCNDGDGGLHYISPLSLQQQGRLSGNFSTNRSMRSPNLEETKTPLQRYSVRNYFLRWIHFYHNRRNLSIVLNVYLNYFLPYLCVRVCVYVCLCLCLCLCLCFCLCYKRYTVPRIFRLRSLYLTSVHNVKQLLWTFQNVLKKALTATLLHPFAPLNKLLEVCICLLRLYRQSMQSFQEQLLIPPNSKTKK